MATTSRKSERVEIITSMRRRRRWSPSEKQSMAKETYEPEAKVSYSGLRSRALVILCPKS